ncbi:family 20 glycosylhydrolase [Carboxylicivirga mesophila]|uniref:beta-N-acetylhexosaminidase n=1 Tax=Carboxylicivirga mesophila TaxID=1166478 RepID=A0ABS5K7M3_9BACT|nr:family 20 glycosylhydrolase [Carboxylicivirga mesophila]MBS2210971.1 family 20 glycosylhydrolase [Carboxylicivirga mesophila]
MKKHLMIMITSWLIGLTGFATNSVKDFLLPLPQTIKVEDGAFNGHAGRIELSGDIKDARVLSELKKVRAAFQNIGLNWNITRACANGESPIMKVSIDGDLDLNEQGYQLLIAANQIELVGVDLAGVYNGFQTLKQIIRYSEEAGYLPLVSITDYPDFKNRGFMLDVSRDKVPTLTTLYQIIDHLAEWKMNQLQLYTEHTFAYQKHQKVWQDYSPYTAEDIITINEYCQERFIELVANQNSLGHMERWLEHTDYQHLAELEKVQKDGPHHLQRRTTLNPVDPRSMELVESLYDELLPNFSSKTVNIGGDEPWELGHGRSKEACDEQGKGEVYISYMSELTNYLSSQGYQPQMWADIILNYPKQLHRLPEDLTCLVWGYRSWYPFEKNSRKMHDAGVPFYVCPGTSSWQSFIGRWPNAQANLLKAAKAGKKYEASGYLITDWGDFGHWQPFVISYPAIIYGAGLSWAVEANESLDVNTHLAYSLMKHPNTELAQLIMELGSVYKLYDGDIQKYVNVFYDILRSPDDPLSTPRLEHVNAENTEAVLQKLNMLIEQLERCPAYNKEQQLLIEELQLAAGFARHSALMAKERLLLPDNKMSHASDSVKETMQEDWDALLAQFRRLWMQRNRSGGLQNSLRGFEPIENAYRINN